MRNFSSPGIVDSTPAPEVAKELERVAGFVMETDPDEFQDMRHDPNGLAAVTYFRADIYRLMLEGPSDELEAKMLNLAKALIETSVEIDMLRIVVARVDIEDKESSDWHNDNWVDLRKPAPWSAPRIVVTPLSGDRQLMTINGETTDVIHGKIKLDEPIYDFEGLPIDLAADADMNITRRWHDHLQRINCNVVGSYGHLVRVAKGLEELPGDNVVVMAKSGQMNKLKPLSAHRGPRHLNAGRALMNCVTNENSRAA